MASEVTLKRCDLESERLLLKPLSIETLPALREKTATQPHLFRYLYLDAENPHELDTWFVGILLDTLKGSAVHYSIYLKNGNQLIGHTSVKNLHSRNRRCEIAWTWLFDEFQKMGYSCESKHMLYRHLFGSGIKRIQILADQKNKSSCNSILRSGAKEEGVFRANRKTLTGQWQNTVVYSILDEDWAQLTSTL